MGTARQYHVPEFEGCLSIKTVVDGAALWKTAGREFVVRENSYLVVNDGQPYTLTIDAAQSVTTFCIFFERGFVEDVFRNATLTVPQLLESPLAERQIQLQFPERLETQESPVLGMVRNLRRRILQSEVSQTALNTELYSIAAKMVNQQLCDSVGHEKVSAIRHSTREELYRRVLRGRDFLLSSLDQPIRLNDIARAACLSSFHFHRVFFQQHGFQRVEFCVPEAFVTTEPRIGLRKPRRLEAAVMGAATDRAFDEPRVLQHPHMFRGAGEAHAERGRQFPDREFAFGQLSKHRPPRWIRKRMKNCIEMGGMFNHTV